MKRSMYQIKRQSGFALLELMFSILILSTLIIGGYLIYSQQFNRQKAEILAKKFGQYANAAIVNIKDNKAFYDKPGNSMNHSGVLWLKSKQCQGLADRSYLPCSFHFNQSMAESQPGIVISADDNSFGNFIQLHIIFHPLNVSISDLAKIQQELQSSFIVPNVSIVIKVVEGKLIFTATFMPSMADSSSWMDVYLHTSGDRVLTNNLAFDKNLEVEARSIEGLSTIDFDGKTTNSLSVIDSNDQKASLMIKSSSLEISSPSTSVLFGKHSDLQAKHELTAIDGTVDIDKDNIQLAANNLLLDAQQNLSLQADNLDSSNQDATIKAADVVLFSGEFDAMATNIAILNKQVDIDADNVYLGNDKANVSLKDICVEALQNQVVSDSYQADVQKNCSNLNSSLLFNLIERSNRYQLREIFTANELNQRITADGMLTITPLYNILACSDPILLSDAIYQHSDGRKSYLMPVTKPQGEIVLKLSDGNTMSGSFISGQLRYYCQVTSQE
ncbi:MAG: type II secretion system protein [Francisellaceae bacterium]